jgi:hypothetical protein
MGVGVLHDVAARKAALYCTTEGRAFGPLFENAAEAEEFMTWLRTSDVPWSVGSHVEGDGTDPRHYPPGDLEEIVNHWRLLVEDGDA